MRWPFRRKTGRHQLGAAVTAIPSAPPAPPPAPDAAPPPVRPAVRTQVVTEPEPAAAPVPPPAASAEPRIELGFRDGSTAALAPGSAQAKALSEIASVLTQRD